MTSLTLPSDATDANRLTIEDTMYEVAGQLRYLRESNRRSIRPAEFPSFPRREHVRVAIDHFARALFPRRLGGLNDTGADEDAFVFRELSAGVSFLEGEIASEVGY